MDLHLSNHIALVTGSSRGIGKAIARAFLAEGCRTVITGRESEPLSQTQEEFSAEFGAAQVMALPGDLTQSTVLHNVVTQILDRWGGLHSVVANIGSGRGNTGWELNEDDWQGLFEQNFWGGVRLVKAALPHMVHAKRGNIVFVASIAGIESLPAPLPYSAAKAALINYCKNLSRLVAQHNVRVNCIAPGNILFPGGSWEKHLSTRRDEVMNHIRSEVPLARFGRPEEVGDLAVFLCSEKAAFITGACMVVDGGQTRSVS